MVGLRISKYLLAGYVLLSATAFKILGFKKSNPLNPFTVVLIIPNEYFYTEVGSTGHDKEQMRDLLDIGIISGSERDLSPRCAVVLSYRLLSSYFPSVLQCLNSSGFRQLMFLSFFILVAVLERLPVDRTASVFRSN